MPEDTTGGLHHVDFGGTEGPDIVLVHGLGGSHLNWDLVAPRLTAHGHVLALDLPGFGLSTPNGRAATVQRNVRVLEDFVRTRAHAPVVLVGNSMGGLVSVLLTARSPELVRALVLLDPALPAPSRVLRSPTAAAQLLMQAIPGVGERVRATRRRRRGAHRTVLDTLQLCGVDPAGLPPDLLERSVALAARQDDVAGMDRAFLSASRSLTWALLRTHRYRAAREAIDVPVLLVHGDRDALVPVAAARTVAAQHPTWRYVELPGAGHLPQLQEPETVGRLIGEWLQSLRHGTPGSGRERSAAADRPAARHGTGEHHGHTRDEPEVVPATGVVHLADADGVGEQRHDERDRQDQPVPEPQPEPGDLRAGDDLRIRSGGTPDQQPGDDEQDH
ncbi:MAG: alpha/beta hydrolase [Pseudonocardia sp.]|nr:alpha/beta hydrolase [Pseudonocardia sp.]